MHSQPPTPTGAASAGDALLTHEARQSSTADLRRSRFRCWPIAFVGGVSLHFGSQVQTGSLQPGASSSACDPQPTFSLELLR